jgi:hypothetical protein
VLFGLTDWFIVSYVEPGRPWVYVAIRAIGVMLIGAVVLRLHLQPLPSPGAVRAIEILTFVGMTVLVSLTCYEFRGIAGPLQKGITNALSRPLAHCHPSPAHGAQPPLSH